MKDLEHTKAKILFTRDNGKEINLTEKVNNFLKALKNLDLKVNFMKDKRTEEECINGLIKILFSNNMMEVFKMDI